MEIINAITNFLGIDLTGFWICFGIAFALLITIGILSDNEFRKRIEGKYDSTKNS
jgi:hypothetical protein